MEEVLCPSCNKKMVSRLNKKTQQRFWGCSDYPNCKGTRNTDGDAPGEKYKDQPLPFDPRPNRAKRTWWDKDDS